MSLMGINVPASLMKSKISLIRMVASVRLPLFFSGSSGFVAGFVVTVLCLSRRTVLHTCHARMLPA